MKKTDAKYKQPQPNTNPLPPGAGYPDKAKTSGVKIRGTGAATKGITARGSMA